MKKNLN